MRGVLVGIFLLGACSGAASNDVPDAALVVDRSFDFSVQVIDDDPNLPPHTIQIAGVTTTDLSFTMHFVTFAEALHSPPLELQVILDDGAPTMKTTIDYNYCAEFAGVEGSADLTDMESVALTLIIDPNDGDALGFESLDCATYEGDNYSAEQ